MVLDAIIKVVITLLTGILGLVPSFSFSDTMWSAGQNIGGALATINGVVPVGTIGECLAVILGVRGFLFVWGLIVFVYDRIPFKAS